MAEKLYFSKHADSISAASLAAELLKEFWPALQRARETGELEHSWKAFWDFLQPGIFVKAAEQMQKSPQRGLDLLVEYFAVLAAVAQTMKEWQETGMLQLLYEEDHGHAVDWQIQEYQLDQDQAVFFALYHRSLARLCQESETRDKSGVVYRLNLQPSADGTHQEVTSLDLIAGVLEQLLRAVHAHTDYATKFACCADIFMQGADKIGALKDFLVKN